MAATLPTPGRALTVKRGATPTLIAGVRTKSLTINGSPIDKTNDDDAAIRKLHDEPGQIDVTITVEGVLVAETLFAEALNATDRVLPTEFGWKGSITDGKMAGDFFMSSFAITGEYQGTATFSATFESAGAVTLTPAT